MCLGKLCLFNARFTDPFCFFYPFHKEKKMEKSDKKAEYISIPTEEHQEEPFAYEVRQKPAFSYRSLAAKGALIAAAILAIGALHKTFTPGNSVVVCCNRI